MTTLTRRFTDAVDYARIAHTGQTRKGTEIPYFHHHLLGVASLVLEFRGNEDQAIAGLLHDVLEDCERAHLGPIRSQFGKAVADIVEDCTDGDAESKAQALTREEKLSSWRQRKLAYLKHLDSASNDTLLVSACDKLHNVRAILGDLENPTIGIKLFERFTGGLDDTLRYYHSLSMTFSRKRSPVTQALDTAISQLHNGVAARMARNQIRQPLE